MTDPSAARNKKKRIVRLVIFLCLIMVPALTYLETWVSQIGGAIPFPVSGNVLVFALININVLLLLLMVFLVLRNLVELIFERRRRFLGTRLRTKLVISFVSLSLIPTGLLFFIALQFVSSSMDYWFNIKVEESLEESLTIAKDVYQDARQQLLRKGGIVAARLPVHALEPGGRQALAAAFGEALEVHDLDGLELISAQHAVLSSFFSKAITGVQVPDFPAELLRRGLAGEQGLYVIQPVVPGELVRGLTPITVRAENGDALHLVLVVSRVIPSERLARMTRISEGIEGYRQLMLLKVPIKTSLLVMLLIVTLLIVFCAIWFGFYVAKGLTGPISALADATRRVAEGELDFVLEKGSGDEMGTLVDSFNSMTRDLRAGQEQLKEANLALRESYQDQETRRRYMEIILQNVAAGVIALDQNGRIATINRFAENLLRIDRKSIIDRDYRTVLRAGQLQVMEQFVAELKQSAKPSIQRHLRLRIGDESFSLRLNLTRLEDDQGKPVGMVLVFDNLTELEKAQRMAAWREVARRIAHEVKNPLTPIQLSAQRLRKKYLGQLADGDEVFDQCTRTIISQVDELKRMVSEFSNFARMPAVQKERNSLAAMVEEAVALYREAHKHIEFRVTVTEEVPPFYFDVKQMKRVLINLVDNAAAVLPKGGMIEVLVRFDASQRLVFFEVLDNGPGVRDEDKLRLFEPYFSTKKTGTGLGLAIASTVVADHGGYIRLKDNPPHGARFIVELPFMEEPQG